MFYLLQSLGWRVPVIMKFLELVNVGKVFCVSRVANACRRKFSKNLLYYTCVILSVCNWLHVSICVFGELRPDFRSMLVTSSFPVFLIRVFWRFGCIIE